MSGPFEKFTAQFDRGGNFVETPTALGRFLYGLIRVEQPAFSIEIGAHIGSTTAWLARGVRENGRGRLWAYEAVPGRAKALRDNLYDIGLAGDVTVVAGDFHANLPPAPVGFAFIDHEPKSDYIAAFDRLTFSERAVVAAHDLTYEPQAKHVEAFRSHIENLGWEVFSIYAYRGLVLGRAPR